MRAVLAELRTKPVLNEFAGNPLLLTMIAIRYRLPMPEESRSYNYATVDCTAEPQRAQRYVKPSALSRPPSALSTGHLAILWYDPAALRSALCALTALRSDRSALH